MKIAHDHLCSDGVPFVGMKHQKELPGEMEPARWIKLDNMRQFTNALCKKSQQLFTTHSVQDLT